MCHKLICVSNRALCAGDFIGRIRAVADAGIPVILREKDLNQEEYYKLLCAIDRENVIAHSFVGAARAFGCAQIHLPLPLLETTDVSGFAAVGVSVHAPEEAARAQALGAAYVTAGHVFATDCKKGLPPRGIGLLAAMKSRAEIPVYAIGGITPENAGEALAAGADGVCAMSGFMQCTDVARYLAGYREVLENFGKM